MTGVRRSGVLDSEMRRFFAAVLASSLPLLAAVPAAADGPSRQVQYAIVATSGGIARRATVTVDFIGGSINRVMNVNVDEAIDDNTQRQASVGIEPTGALRSADAAQLTAEEETICSLISMGSEDLEGVETGDHWEREGALPGGRHHTRFSVIGVTDTGYVDFAVARDLRHNDGSSAQWRGTMHYDSTAAVPATIALNGSLIASDDPAAGRNVAMTIRLVHDTFKR
jgi:hypothetical protein